MTHRMNLTILVALLFATLALVVGCAEQDPAPVGESATPVAAEATEKKCSGFVDSDGDGKCDKAATGECGCAAKAGGCDCGKAGGCDCKNGGTCKCAENGGTCECGKAGGCDCANGGTLRPRRGRRPASTDFPPASELRERDRPVRCH